MTQPNYKMWERIKQLEQEGKSSDEIVSIINKETIARGSPMAEAIANGYEERKKKRELKG